MSVQEITNRAFINKTDFIELMSLNGVGQAVAKDMWKVVQKRVETLLYELGKVLPSKRNYPTDLVLVSLEEYYGITKRSLRRMK
jgi:hypothetical protein